MPLTQEQEQVKPSPKKIPEEAPYKNLFHKKFSERFHFHLYMVGEMAESEEKQRCLQLLKYVGDLPEMSRFSIFTPKTSKEAFELIKAYTQRYSDYKPQEKTDSISKYHNKFLNAVKSNLAYRLGMAVLSTVVAPFGILGVGFYGGVFVTAVLPTAFFLSLISLVMGLASGDGNGAAAGATVAGGILTATIVPFVVLLAPIWAAANYFIGVYQHFSQKKERAQILASFKDVVLNEDSVTNDSTASTMGSLGAGKRHNTAEHSHCLEMDDEDEDASQAYRTNAAPPIPDNMPEIEGTPRARVTN